MNETNPLTTTMVNIYTAFPYEDVFCQKCRERLGAFVGKAYCRRCGTVAIVLTDKKVRT